MAIVLTFDEIENRLRDDIWNIPKLGETDLWAKAAKKLMPKKKLRNLINVALVEWAMETEAEKDVWNLDDGLGNVGLTIDQRQYGLPADLMIATEARVNYDDTKNFRGSPIVFSSEPFIDSSIKAGEIVTKLPERIFIWGNQFEVDPVPDAAYTFRFFGYRRPSTLAVDTDQLDTYEYTQENLYLKCKVVVARDLRDKNRVALMQDYHIDRDRLQEFDRQRHNTVDIMRFIDFGDT